MKIDARPGGENHSVAKSATSENRRAPAKRLHANARRRPHHEKTRLRDRARRPRLVRKPRDDSRSTVRTRVRRKRIRRRTIAPTSTSCWRRRPHPDGRAAIFLLECVARASRGGLTAADIHLYANPHRTNIEEVRIPSDRLGHRPVDTPAARRATTIPVLRR